MSLSPAGTGNSFASDAITRGPAGPSAAKSGGTAASGSQAIITSTGGRALIVHAPAVVQVMIEGDLDDFGFAAAARCLSVPARSTQSRLRMTSALRIASAASGVGAMVPGAPTCSG